MTIRLESRLARLEAEEGRHSTLIGVVCAGPLEAVRTLLVARGIDPDADHVRIACVPDGGEEPRIRVLDDLMPPREGLQANELEDRELHYALISGISEAQLCNEPYGPDEALLRDALMSILDDKRPTMQRALWAGRSALARRVDEHLG